LVHVHTHSPPPIAKIIGLPTYESPNVYTVAFKDGSVSEYTYDLLSVSSVSAPGMTPSLLPTWIQKGANATLFLHNMSKPRHGTLDISTDSNWYFYPGKSKEGILLPDLSANCQHLMDTAQLFRGHAKFKNVYDARAQLSLKDCILCHVSAHGLQSLIAPLSLRHHAKMSPGDRHIWDSAYNEVYAGLESLPT
jgi:hypothetical protein